MCLTNPSEKSGVAQSALFRLDQRGADLLTDAQANNVLASDHLSRHLCSENASKIEVRYADNQKENAGNSEL